MDYLTLKRYNTFQNENNRKASPSFASRPVIFMSQQPDELLKLKKWKF